MERKTTNILEKFGAMPDYTDFLPKVSIRSKDALPTPIQFKTVRKKFSDITPGLQDSEINLFNKFLKNDLSMLLKVGKNIEEKKNDLHLPVLSKKELKQDLTSNSNYRSPTLSPCFTRIEFPINKRSEIPSPTIQENEANYCEAEIYISEVEKRGSSANRGTKFRKARVKSSKQSSKQREANLDILLMNRNNSDLSFFMNEYSRRQGLAENSKIFIITGQHDFMRRSLKKRGWVENKNSNSQAFHLKWCISDCEYDYKNLKQGQIYNHFLNNRELTTKSGIAKNLRNITDCKINVDKFFPRCYDLGDNLQIKELIIDYQRTSILNIIKKALKGWYIDEIIMNSVINYAEELIANSFSMCENIFQEIKKENLAKLYEYKAKTKGEINKNILEKLEIIVKKLRIIFPQFDMEGDENIWIIKPGQNARGSGVRCVRDIEEILDSGSKMQSRVVQKYAENPLLLPLNIGLCKFDMRLWVLVTNFDPLSIYFYNSCYCRICQEAYSLESLESIKHLANYSVQKSVAKTASDTVWNLSQLVNHLTTVNASWTEILKKIHFIIINTLQAVADNIDSRTGCFELYGFDIILDDTFQPWLLEVNLSPACAERTEWLTSMLDSMGDGLLNIVLDKEVQEPIYDKSLIATRDIIGNTQEWIFLYKSETTGEDYCLTKANLEIFGEKFNLKREKNNEKKFLMTRAAFILQRHGRRFLIKLREEKKKINHSVKNIQKIIRRKIAYALYSEKIKNISATKIQSFWRMHLAKKTLQKLKDIKDIECIQSVLKTFIILQRFNKCKIEKASLCIQLIIRTKYCKDIVKKKKYFLKCVKIIQKFYKKRFMIKKSLATKIQKSWRGRQGRQKFNKEKAFQISIRNIQKITRKFLAGLIKQQKKEEKAKKIIANFKRIHIALKSLSYYLDYRSAIIIQKYWRRHAAKKIFSQKKNEKKLFIQGICFIQKILKGVKERKRFKILKENRAATIIQKYFRGYRARNYWNVLRKVNKCAVIIQKNFRGYKCRRKYAMMKRILNQEIKRKENMIRIKKEKEQRAIQASERLFKGKGIPEIPNTITYNIEKYNFDYKSDKIDRIKHIYTYNKEDFEGYQQLKYERTNLIRDVIEEFKPPKRDKAKTKKTKKKTNASVTQYGKLQY